MRHEGQREGDSLAGVTRPLLASIALAAVAAAPAQEVIAIDSRVLTFAPSRDDMTVGKAVVSIHAPRPEEVRLGGKPLPEAWHVIELERVGPNRFALPPLRLEVPAGYEGLLCLSVKVWFAEVDNRADSLFYEKTDDRYALVAWSNRADGPAWERAKARFAQNRVATLDELKERLARPFPIALNRRPLSDADALREPR